MIATYHSQAFHNQLQSTPWTAEQLYDFELPETTDAVDERSSGSVALDSVEDRDRVLNQLRHLTVSSLSSFEEIASATTDLHLSSFADVVVRQRTAHQHALFELVGCSLVAEDDADHESLATLRSLWRGAIWNLEQGYHGLFLEYAERAESVLEEAYLAAAQALGNDPIADEIRGYAIMVCGSRALIEELADSINRHVPVDFRDSRIEGRRQQEASAAVLLPTSRKPLVKRSVQKAAPTDRPLLRGGKLPKLIRAGKSHDWQRPATDRSKLTTKARSAPRAGSKSMLTGRR